MIPKATAFHEAAHAVAAWYAGEFIHAIHVASTASTFTDRRGREVRARGMAELSGRYAPGVVPLALVPPEVLPVFRRAAVVSMMVDRTGPLAEARVSRKSGVLIALSSGSDDYEHFRLTVEEFPAHERDAMRQEADSGARRLVRYGWPAIERLASAMERGSLDGDEATAIVEGSWTMGVLSEVPRQAHARPVPKKGKR